ncbi:hypothetical protein [Leminorella grimontii]|uniref:hypothetical protein n=1 Tax=Leminorella grimontii TaxID=82981 RepID=UPI0032200750
MIKAKLTVTSKRKHPIKTGYRPLFLIDNEYFSGVVRFDGDDIHTNEVRSVDIEFASFNGILRPGDVIRFFESSEREVGNLLITEYLNKSVVCVDYMIDIEKEIRKIESAIFFSRMGINDLPDDSIILIESVRKAFVEPTESDFHGYYSLIAWLPTSSTQEDPFYSKKAMPEDLMAMRAKVNKAILLSTRNMKNDPFLCGAHSFSVAARSAIGFAFRQYVYEQYFDLGNLWQRIVDIYYQGHWPVGYAKEKLVII